MTEQQRENSNTETHQTEKRLENAIIPIIEERAVINKEIVETGKVRISKRVSEHEEIIDEPLLREEVSVERVAVNQFVDTPPEIRHEGDTMIIPVVEERMVIEKRLFLVEEMHVRKQVVESHQPQRITLQKEEVEVKRVAYSKNSDR
ncbi:MAG: YsnF/AvaK domain-containing protein [Acidobacteriota bacterium]